MMATMKFGDFVEVNPKIKLEKDKEYEFVEMADVDPSRKYVYSKQIKRPKGGAKFMPGDVLFARITPCLEHGKIALYQSDSLNPAFGSTEFYVFREKKGISNKNYIYYLSKTDIIRKPAEKSMVGASGRQRANIDAIKDIIVDTPDIDLQNKIATFLTNYDDLIEINLKRMHVLEKIAKLVFDEWFVKYKFPGFKNKNFVESERGKIPEKWNWNVLGDILTELESGSRPKGGVGQIKEGIPSIGAENINGLGKYNYKKDKFVSEIFFNKMKRGIVKHKDVLLYKDGAKIGRKTMFRNDYPYAKCCVNEHAFILRTQDDFYQNYMYFWLDQFWMTEKIILLNTNAAQPGINQPGVKSLPILIPEEDLIKDFNNIIDPILNEIFNLAKTNNSLMNTRNALLPKLIHKEIEISELNIHVPEVEA
jgi:type I restriction enzyme, S subunit